MSRKPSKRKMHPNGRSKDDAKHIRHYKWQLTCEAWKSLSMTARCMEMELKALYNGDNNGELFLSIREAARRLGVAANTASKAFDELVEKGFIRPYEKGSFNYKKRHATSWILTEYEYRGQLPTKDFMRWQVRKNQPQNLLPMASKFKASAQNMISSMSTRDALSDTQKH